MSFLNPINEPVLRFSSTDAGAPQINYNARVAGDVKAVLKACLVAGYGTKAGAGWTVVNEVAHVAEFVSPSAAMSDYMLGIDDTSATDTTWYYQYQNVRENPQGNTTRKNINIYQMDPAKSAWQLLVTDQGVLFVEVYYNLTVNNHLARLTYWGRIKDAIVANAGRNIAFWSTGYGQDANPPYSFFTGTGGKHYRVGDYTSVTFSASNITMLASSSRTFDGSYVDISSALYLKDQDTFIGEQPAVLASYVASESNLYGVGDVVVASRPMLSACISYEANQVSALRNYSQMVYLALDYWEY